MLRAGCRITTLEHRGAKRSRCSRLSPAEPKSEEKPRKVSEVQLPQGVGSRPREVLLAQEDLQGRLRCGEVPSPRQSHLPGSQAHRPDSPRDSTHGPSVLHGHAVGQKRPLRAGTTLRYPFPSSARCRPSSGSAPRDEQVPALTGHLGRGRREGKKRAGSQLRGTSRRERAAALQRGVGRLLRPAHVDVGAGPNRGRGAAGLGDAEESEEQRPGGGLGSQRWGQPGQSSWAATSHPGRGSQSYRLRTCPELEARVPRADRTQSNRTGSMRLPPPPPLRGRVPGTGGWRSAKAPGGPRLESRGRRSAQNATYSLGAARTGPLVPASHATRRFPPGSSGSAALRVSGSHKGNGGRRQGCWET